MYGWTFQTRLQMLSTFIPNDPSIFVMLFSTYPDLYGLNWVEVSTVGTGYARVSPAEWSIGADGPDVWRSTPDPIEFPVVAQEYEAVGWGIASVSEEEINLIVSGPLRVAEDGLALPVTFPVGDVPRIVDIRARLR